MANDPTITFGAWLRGRRAELRQTQEEAAAALDVSPNLVLAWEGERKVPVKVAHVLRIAEWAGVERAEVLDLVAQGHETAAA